MKNGQNFAEFFFYDSVNNSIVPNDNFPDIWSAEFWINPSGAGEGKNDIDFIEDPAGKKPGVMHRIFLYELANGRQFIQGLDCPFYLSHFSILFLASS